LATISTDNYAIGIIDVYFDASAAHASLLATTGGVTIGSPFRTAARNIGNIVSAELNTDVSYIEHFISVLGKRRRDKIVSNTESIGVSFTFDEINEDNLNRFLLGSSLGSNKVAPMSQPVQRGSLSLIFRSDVGNDFVYSIPRGILRPDGNLAMNTEDWWSAPMMLDAEYYNTGEWASKPYGVINLL